MRLVKHSMGWPNNQILMLPFKKGSKAPLSTGKEKVVNYSKRKQKSAKEYVYCTIICILKVYIHTYLEKHIKMCNCENWMAGDQRWERDLFFPCIPFSTLSNQTNKPEQPKSRKQETHENAQGSHQVFRNLVPFISNSTSRPFPK